MVEDISHEGLRELLRAEGVSFQAVKTWKSSADPDYAAKKARIDQLYAIADRETAPAPASTDAGEEAAPRISRCAAQKYDSGWWGASSWISGGSHILVDQAAQDRFSADLVSVEIPCRDAGRIVLSVGDALVDALVGPGHVVMRLVVGQDGTQVCLAENQHARTNQLPSMPHATRRRCAEPPSSGSR